MKHSHAILYEMMRSFASLARTLNLSRTVRELNSTRQTVRRHISILEDEMGVKLFTVRDRMYHLTEAGHAALREAEDLISRADAWVKHKSGHDDGLYYLAHSEGPESPYFLQQHPLSRLWDSDRDLLRHGFQCWTRARGEIEHPEFEKIRPYIILFRKLATDWVCVEVGPESSYSTWYGWRWQRSSVGRPVDSLPAGSGFANLLAQPFNEVHDTHGFRLDHIHTQMRSDEGDEHPLVPISYQRLLLGCRFPDGSFALAALIDRTHDIEIRGLSREAARSMPEELVMEYSIPLSEK